MFGPYLVIFNPFLVPWIVKQLNWPHIIYRFPGNTALPDAIVFGAAAYVLTLFLRTKRKCSRGMSLVPLLAFIILFSLPVFNPSLRKVMTSALDNRSWYPSLLDLSNDTLYRGLSQLKPGIVAVERRKTGYVAALTPHYLVAGHYNTGSIVFTTDDKRLVARRWADNEKILVFDITAQEMRQLLDEYHCRYVIVSRASPRLARFRAYPDLFDPVLETETDMVFYVTR
jgi:hypothetical protein